MMDEVKHLTLTELEAGLDDIRQSPRQEGVLALIQVTNQPHTGCAQFSQRFGAEGLKFVNSPVGKALHLRGIYTRVVQSGVIRVGDVMKKV